MFTRREWEGFDIRSSAATNWLCSENKKWLMRSLACNNFSQMRSLPTATPSKWQRTQYASWNLHYFRKRKKIDIHLICAWDGAYLPIICIYWVSVPETMRCATCFSVKTHIKINGPRVEVWHYFFFFISSEIYRSRAHKMLINLVAESDEIDNLMNWTE